MPYKDSEESRRYMRDRRELFRRLKVCSWCQKQDAYTLAGRWYCFECSERRRKKAH